MQKGGLWIALSLLALVAGSIAYLYYQDSNTESESPLSENTVFPGGLKQLSSIKLQREGEPEIIIQATGPDQWEIAAPGRYKTDLVAMGNLTGAVRVLEAERTIDALDANQEEFGLHAPMLRLELSEGEVKHILEIGGVNPLGSSRYARLAGTPKLYLISMASVVALNKSLGELRLKKVLDTNEFSARSIRIESPAGNREVYRKENRDWTFREPQDFFADQPMMSELVNSILTVQTDAASLDGESVPEDRFRAMPLYGTVRAATESAEYLAEFRGTPGDVYARSESIGGIYPVAAEFDNYLRKPLANFRDMRVFRFGFTDVFQMRYVAHGQDFTIQKPNENWMREGTQVDASKANTLLDELRAATATAFEEGTLPAGELTHTLTVETSDGREETVQIHLSGEAHFAVRSGEKGYYSLPLTFVKDLDEAANALAQ